VTFCVCNQAPTCPKDYQMLHSCRHAKPHKNYQDHPGAVVNCQNTPCERGGLCSPLDLVHVINERELP